MCELYPNGNLTPVAGEVLQIWKDANVDPDLAMAVIEAVMPVQEIYEVDTAPIPPPPWVD